MLKKKLAVKFVFICIMMLFSVTCAAFAAQEYVEGEVIVVLNIPANQFRVASAMGVNTLAVSMNAMADSFVASSDETAVKTYPDISRVSGTNIVVIRSTSKTTEELIRQYKDDPRVKGVSPNYIMKRGKPAPETPAPEKKMSALAVTNPNDTEFNTLWNMKHIGMPSVWGRVTGSVTASPVTVAILDTGVDYNHEDLKANIAIDSRGKPGAYFYRGADWETVVGDPIDENGHGTHVAGIIGAVGNNGLGVTGINWNVKILPVKVMTGEQLGGELIDKLDGIAYILSEKNKGMNIKVVNMSYGGWLTGGKGLLPYEEAIKSLSDAGILCVMASGNEEQDIDNPVDSVLYNGCLPYPAAFRFDNTITVGAINPSNGKSNYSNYSSKWVHIAAPGDSIYSTILTSQGKYGYKNGTSMATPHVAGAAALLFAAYPNETATQIKARLLNGAKKVGVSEGYWEYGVLDVIGAYNIGNANPLPYPDPNDDTDPNDDDEPIIDDPDDPKDPEGSGDGGGGGCNAAGFGYYALFLIGLLSTKKRAA